MKTERRNLYRLLHVQPEAPAEVITAVYRCLMTKLKMHPDLGGDHALAARINDAYAVLGDPVKRRAYDLKLKTKHTPRSQRASTGQPSFRADHSTFDSSFKAAHPKHANDTTNLDKNSCPFCQATLPGFVAVDTRCQQCDSPLSPIAFNLRAQREQFGRRMAHRIARHDSACLLLKPGESGIAARLHDMSLNGVGIVTTVAVKKDAVVRMITDSVDALVHVVATRKVNGLHHLHTRLLTARFGKTKGVLFSVSA